MIPSKALLQILWLSFGHIIIHFLLWIVIHFQQIYSECMLSLAMSVSLHLTSVSLCMSVVFVVTVQWPIGTKVTSPFNFIAKHLSLRHEFETFSFVESVNHDHQLSAMWNVKMNCWWIEKNKSN